MQRPLAVRDGQLGVAARCISEKGRYSAYEMESDTFQETLTCCMLVTEGKRLRRYGGKTWVIPFRNPP